jgi:hypothetical protein
MKFSSAAPITVLEKKSALRVPSVLREGSARKLEDGSALALRVGSALDEREGDATSGDFIAVSSPSSPALLCSGNLTALENGQR